MADLLRFAVASQSGPDTKPVARSAIATYPSPKREVDDPVPEALDSALVSGPMSAEVSSAWGPGMKVSNTVIHCERVSVIVLDHSEDEYIEWGWYETDPDIQAIPCGAAGTSPRLFATYTNLGPLQCAYDPSPPNYPTPGQCFDFRIDNFNLDDIFDLRFDGPVLASTPDLLYSTGYAVVWSERYQNAPDSAWAEWKDLRYMSGSGWHLWDSSGWYADNDPCYTPDQQGVYYWWKVVHDC